MVKTWGYRVLNLKDLPALLSPNCESQDSTIATVSNLGLVSPVAVGTVTITAIYLGKTGSLGVTVVPAGQIRACGPQTGPGPFVLAADILSPSVLCVSFSNNIGASLDCHGFDAGSISLSNVQGFSIHNCLLHGSVTLGVGVNLSVTTGSAVTVDSTDVYGEALVQNCQNCTISNSKFAQVPANNAGIFFKGGHGNQVINNTIDGGWNGNFVSYTKVGADDGIVLEYEADDIVRGNTISNVFDAGIEEVSTVAHTTTIQNNTITTAALTGIGGYYVAGWQNAEHFSLGGEAASCRIVARR